MLGRAHHFRRYAPEQIQYAVDRYTNEARRIYGVIDKRVSETPYLAGEYSIADMAPIHGCELIIGRARIWRISLILSAGTKALKHAQRSSADSP